MSPEPGIPLREGLKIRHYIFNIVLRHPGESVKVPSSWELAKHFGIARSTVTLAYKELMQEGILIGRPGIGTFLAPRYSQGLGNSGITYPLVGMLTNLGNNLCYGSHQWGLMAAAGNSLTYGDICQLRPVTLSGNIETLKHELEQNYLDAMVWITPPEDQTLLLQDVCRDLPTVILGRTTANINSVALDYEEESYQNGKRLIAEGRKKFWAVNMSGSEYYIPGFRRAYAEAGIQLDDRFIFDPSNRQLEELDEALRAGFRPDALLLHSNRRKEVIELLLKAGIDLKHECRVLSNIAAAEIPGFAGWCHDVPYEEFGKAAAEIIFRLLKGDRSVEHRILEHKNIPVNLD